MVENSVLVDQSVTDFNEENRPSSPSLHLAMGLGMNVDGFGGSNNAADYISTNSDQSTSCEELYRRMVEENPRSSMLLRNYAQFLHQVKCGIFRLSYMRVRVDRYWRYFIALGNF